MDNQWEAQLNKTLIFKDRRVWGVLTDLGASSSWFIFTWTDLSHTLIEGRLTWGDSQAFYLIDAKREVERLVHLYAEQF